MYHAQPESWRSSTSRGWWFSRWSNCRQSNHWNGNSFINEVWNGEFISGWWLSHPSEKYEFVSWDDYSQYMRTFPASLVWFSEGKISNVFFHGSDRLSAWIWTIKLAVIGCCRIGHLHFNLKNSECCSYHQHHYYHHIIMCYMVYYCVITCMNMTS